MQDKKADARCAALIRKVDTMRRQLRTLEAEMNREVMEYGKRRGYLCGFREFHAKQIMQQEGK